MAVVLNNIPAEHFNTNILTHHFTDFYIINEKSRRVLANLFDCLGNIASYNDYYAFFRNFKHFGEFKKSKISDKLKTKLKNDQGIVVFIDYNTLELDIPCISMERWFVDNYSRVFNKPVESFYNTIKSNNIPLDYNKYKSDLINNTNFLFENNQYPLSEDEMTLMPIYSTNFTLTIKPEKYYGLVYDYSSDDESTYSDNSDDVHAYLKNKNRITNPNIEITNPTIQVTNPNIEVTNPNVLAKQDNVEKQQDIVEEQQDNVEEQQDNVEVKSSNTLAKELFEKHNTQQSSNTNNQSGYSSRFWGLFGWK